MTTPLPPNTLSILLYLRDSPPTPNNYHWALYHHPNTPTTSSPFNNPQPGTKYHIKTEDSATGWLADHNTTASILTQFLLVGAFIIATVPDGAEDYLDRALRRYDECLNTGIEGVTCRVWVLRVLEGLMTDIATGYGGGGSCGGILQCADLGELEKEVLEWGNSFAGEADRNVQPRPVGVSRLCGLGSLDE